MGIHSGKLFNENFILHHFLSKENYKEYIENYSSTIQLTSELKEYFLED